MCIFTSHYLATGPPTKVAAAATVADVGNPELHYSLRCIRVLCATTRTNLGRNPGGGITLGLFSSFSVSFFRATFLCCCRLHFYREKRVQPSLALVNGANVEVWHSRAVVQLSLLSPRKFDKLFTPWGFELTFAYTPTHKNECLTYERRLADCVPCAGAEDRGRCFYNSPPRTIFSHIGRVPGDV